jgi:hypothetical protein
MGIALLLLGKTYFLQFVTRNTRALDLHMLCEKREKSDVNATTFLGLVIDHKLPWQHHIDQMIPNLNKASYIMMVLKTDLSLECLKRSILP